MEGIWDCGQYSSKLHIIFKVGILIDFIYEKPFTAYFPRANIHELIASDLLHQLIKGGFKDCIVAWVETYLEITWGKVKAKAMMDEIDRWCVIVFNNSVKMLKL